MERVREMSSRTSRTYCGAPTVISFKFKVKSFVRLSVCDVLGREIATIVSDRLLANSYQVRWDAGNFPSGVYLSRL
jgi:hypothetical protein